MWFFLRVLVVAPQGCRTHAKAREPRAYSQKPLKIRGAPPPRTPLRHPTPRRTVRAVGTPGLSRGPHDPRSDRPPQRAQTARTGGPGARARLWRAEAAHAARGETSTEFSFRAA